MIYEVASKSFVSLTGWSFDEVSNIEDTLLINLELSA